MDGLFGRAGREGSEGRFAGRWAQVAVEQGLERAEGLTYGIPEELADLAAGDRVVVPLGRGDRRVSGYVLSVHGPGSGGGEAEGEGVDWERVKMIAGRDRHAVRLPGDLLELARWISRYYCCPLGMVFASMMPAAVKHGTGLVRRVYLEMAEQWTVAMAAERAKELGLRGKAAAVMTVMAAAAERGEREVERGWLMVEADVRGAGPIGGLVERGVLREVVKMEVKAVWDEAAAGEARKEVQLNADQQAAVETIGQGAAKGEFGVTLLHGVTGSGKTEVYIRVIEAVVKAGRQAIVLVPEISLTPQTVGRFVGRFGQVAVLHSGLTAAQRHQQWALIRDGWAQVVVGARSAVFAPVERLGLIVVDEEHDGSYKQDQAPRYHARDVAIKRAQMAGAWVVLGSATPSLESWHNATGRGVYGMVKLPRRVSEQAMPRVEIVDMVEERRKRHESGTGRGFHVLSVALERALGQCFAEGGQAMLLLNRRGFANYIACADANCGWQMKCDHCDVAMVYHKMGRLPGGGLVRCHYCTAEQMLPTVCPMCSKKVVVLGQGTQRVEEEIAQKFPGVATIRMDSDAMRTARDYHESLAAFGRGEAQMLIGTQMIAKGLDFANVRVVGVISADTALNMPDFRSSERTFQLVCQVAGRSGRGEAAGRVFVQSFEPTNPAIVLAAGHDYERFAAQEIEHRRSNGLPPIARMARVVVRDEDLSKAQEQAGRLAEVIRKAAEEVVGAAGARSGAGAAGAGVSGAGIPGVAMPGGVRVVGPMEAPIARIGDYHRQQIELIADHAGWVQMVLGRVRQQGLITSDFHTAVDVDPTSLL